MRNLGVSQKTLFGLIGLTPLNQKGVVFFLAWYSIMFITSHLDIILRVNTQNNRTKLISTALHKTAAAAFVLHAVHVREEAEGKERAKDKIHSRTRHFVLLK